MSSIFLTEKLTDRSLIESIIAGHYIIDYGYIKAVNADGTIDVTHAKQLKTLDGTSLSATVTTGIEMLTIAGAGFSLKFDYKKGDKVLLVGLKDYVPKVGEVKSATETTAYMHYSRETLKALPLCVFSEESTVKVVVESGTFSITTDQNIELNGTDYGGLCKTPELVKQLSYLTTRVDTIINALQNSPTAAQDGGATYKAGITSTLSTIVNKEDFSNVESDKVQHGKGA